MVGSSEKLRASMQFITSFIICIILSGCASLTQSVSTLAPPESSSVSRVLLYYRQAQTLGPVALHALYQREKAHVGESGDSERTLRVALLLTLRGTTFHDSGRAAALLQDYTQQPRHDGELRALASLLLNTLSEAQRQVTRYRETKLELAGVMKEKSQIERSYERAKDRLARVQDERSKHEKHYQQVNEALRQEKETVENLRYQIEQLKIIEKMLNERKPKKSPAT